MLPSESDVNALYEEWEINPEIKIKQKPKVEVLGLTFLVQDPDGHMIRVCLLD